MANYAIKNIGGWAKLQGKVFMGEELGLTGAEASLQRLAAGEDAPFLHSHKTHEEIYVIISSQGEFEVDGEKNAVGEGSVIRVSPAGVRALRNTFLPLVDNLIEWAKDNMDEIVEGRRRRGLE